MIELADLNRPVGLYDTLVDTGVGVVESGVWVEAVSRGLRLRHSVVHASKRVSGHAASNRFDMGDGFGGFGLGFGGASGGGAKKGGDAESVRCMGEGR